MESISRPKEADSSPSVPHLRNRRTILCFLAFYLLVLVIPWVLTSITMFRPLSHPLYIDQQGVITTRDVEIMKSVSIFINVLSKIASTLAVPVVSALLSQAAVAYSGIPGWSHRRFLNLRQLFALADRGWSDLPIIWAALGDNTIGSRFLWMGAGLVCIAALQPALQPILIPDENMAIVVRESDLSFPYVFGFPGTIELGTDPEPGLLARVPRDVVLRQTQARIIEVKSDDIQQYLWYDTMSISTDTIYDVEIEYTSKGTLGWYYQGQNISYWRSVPLGHMYDVFFASSVSKGTSTGVLRYHAIRQQSLSSCETISHADFPPTYSGDNPFVAEYSIGGVYFRICVEGNQNQALWSLTRDSQLISEHVWMDAVLENASSTAYYLFPEDGVAQREFTIHCTANSTRGFFELNNLYNDNSYGSLLDTWPLPGAMSSFNDDLADELCCYGCGPLRPNDWAEDVTVNINWTNILVNSNTDSEIHNSVPGPLMAATLAVFGNYSFFDLAQTVTTDTFESLSRTVCNGLMIPFSRYSSDISLDKIGNHLCTQHATAGRNHTDVLSVLIWNFVSLFSDINKAIQLLEVTMYFANEAHLTIAARAAAKIFSTENHTGPYPLSECMGGQGSQIGRTIYSNPGTTIIKPKQSLAGVIIISILITLEVLGLLMLAFYICSSTTWTQTLNAYALARIGALLAPQMKAEGIDGLHEHPRPKDVQKALAGISALVGTVSHDCETEVDTESNMLLTESTATFNEDDSSTEESIALRRRVTR